MDFERFQKLHGMMKIIDYEDFQEKILIEQIPHFKQNVIKDILSQKTKALKTYFGQDTSYPTNEDLTKEIARLNSGR
jgi:hypothetical protein